MYVTAIRTSAIALDAGTRPQDLALPPAAHRRVRPAGSANRGVAVAGDRVFMETDNAHVIALNRLTGELLWDTEMADWHQNYFASSAPLTAGNLVIAGVTGGEHGATASSRRTIRRPARRSGGSGPCRSPGEPGSETWEGKGIEHGGAPTWFTGSYDPELDHRLLADRQSQRGVQRRRSRRATTSTRTASWRSIAKTGKLKWHYQFTPHDLWDWDATADPGADRRELAGPAAQAAAARQPQRLLLRLRPHATASCCSRNRSSEPDLGQRHRRRRPSDQAPEPGADAGGHQGLPVAGRRDQLVLAVLQSRRPASTTSRRSRSAASTRRATRRRGQSGKTYLGGSQKTATGSEAAAHSARPSISRPARSRGNCRSPARRTRGAAR